MLMQYLLLLGDSTFYTRVLLFNDFSNSFLEY